MERFVASESHESISPVTRSVFAHASRRSRVELCGECLIDLYADFDGSRC
jgi:hypothetical protein